MLNDIGGKHGCILILLGNQNTITTPAFQKLAGLTSGVVLAVPSSIENIGNFMLEARKARGLVPLARTFHDARQWYPTAGRLLDIGMTDDELREFERNPRKINREDKVDDDELDDDEVDDDEVDGDEVDDDEVEDDEVEDGEEEEEEDFVAVTFRNKANFKIDLTWVGQGTRVKDSKDSRNNWHLAPNGRQVVPMPVNVRHKFFMINGHKMINIFTRVFKDDAVVDLAAIYRDAD
jgi:hypothetical protein